MSFGESNKKKALKSHDFRAFLLVETIGIEPMTSCMSSKRSNHLGYASGDGVYYIIRF